jgi:hypothetical protein
VTILKYKKIPQKFLGISLKRKQMKNYQNFISKEKSELKAL